MKRTHAAFILIFSLFLSACGQSTPTWQEQYDMGVRYLSEGNYEEAIIAFTAAIEIDPKQALAYLGRGDSYVGSGTTEENLAAALTDYELAIELDEANVVAYLRLADVYIRKGEYDKSLEILKQGLEKTDHPDIMNKLSELEKQTIEEPTVDGTISIGGSGHNMELSITWPGLPKEVWVGQRNGDITFASISLSFSDGKSTFQVGTDILSESTEYRMIAIPDGEDCQHYLSIAYASNGDYAHTWNWIQTHVDATRKNDTLLWSFEMPEAGFDVSDISYISYHFYYTLGPESELINKTATFRVSNGAVTYMNDKTVEDMGFKISLDTAKRLFPLS